MDFFIECKEKHDTSDKYPNITTEVHESIKRDNFLSNEKLIEVLNSVADLIRNTGSPLINPAHIFVEWLNLYMKLKNLKNITNSLTWNLFINHVFNRFNALFMQYLNDMVYVISIYLWGAYWYFTISKHYTYKMVRRTIVTLHI